MLSTSITLLPRTSALTIKRFGLLGINTYEDLLLYAPLRYEDYSKITPINLAIEGDNVTIQGIIVQAKQVYTRRGLKIQQFILEDKTGHIEVVFYNQPYLLTIFKRGVEVSVSGTIERFGNKKVIKPNEFEVGKNNINTGRLLPIYSEAKGLSSRTIREKILYVCDLLLSSIDGISDYLPKEIRSYNGLIQLSEVFEYLHRPISLDQVEKARKRLAFDEMFILQYSTSLVKTEWRREKIKEVFSLENKYSKLNKCISDLPFKLTNSQLNTWEEIKDDLLQDYPMNRLLQGDVGSGKTVISYLASFLAYLNGYKTLIMAPTEILANQHYDTFLTLVNKTSMKIGLITGSKQLKKTDNIEEYDVIIGTHALIQNKITVSKVGLVIIDEQQRFGVSQRAMLKDKGTVPHLLTMTATPIPRTVALTLYGELDFSVITEMPKGRVPIKTYFVPKEKREDGYRWMEKEMKKNNSQIFIVCPFIEESENETLASVKAVIVEYEKLKKIFRNFKVGLLHGRMKSKDKEKTLKEFRDKKFDILLATPVVEVGIDISNATVMVIEGAERYGLSQLHQLRGRVGRGDKQSYCFVFTEKEEESIIKRLKFFASTNKGKELADYDLKHRGPGSLFGTKQHGYLDLKFASLSDFDLISKTSNAVKYFMSNYDLSNYPSLENKIREYTKDRVSRD